MGTCRDGSSATAVPRRRRPRRLQRNRSVTWHDAQWMLPATLANSPGFSPQRTPPKLGPAPPRGPTFPPINAPGAASKAPGYKYPTRPCSLTQDSPLHTEITIHLERLMHGLWRCRRLSAKDLLKQKGSTLEEPNHSLRRIEISKCG
ncbi:hypothetical protein BHE74_00003722 [Ensete ventricosum]|nr:hypothetical protein BHE74_00003722 [Ensete ventricosum]